ncbi:MAG TPA: VanZ family protein [Gemmatimonadaceae bacterium]|nr:VanZ family protein [Gemmatimonadaceae bacterium]
MPAITAPAGTDKGVHAVLYLVLGFLAARALLAERTARVWQLLILLLALLAFGAVDELHQRFIPGRTADTRDWVADSVGSVVGLAAGLARGRRRAVRAI